MSQPRNLPAGVWEALLPKALTLVDEIAKHGRADPFFTFGGGTVLMLRHNHRLSKDIDLFVPDAQSLGYVNPRLSAVAEEMCGSDYRESSEFIKIQLPEGEIDFVASPNLLPDHQAFETWELLGRRINVETSAEIVAKKIYHRGDQGTARDLFDLAMVIEREPEALLNARAFFYRYLERVSAAMVSPPQAMLDRFDAIDVIDYKPTFQHAAAIVESFLEQLRIIHANSVQQAETYIAALGLTHQETDLATGDYSGPIVYRTERHAIQSVGCNDAVVHDIGALGYYHPDAFKSDPTVVRVRYKDNRATVGKAALKVTNPSR